MSGFLLYVAPDGGITGGISGLEGHDFLAQPGEYVVWDVERAWRNYLALAMGGA